MDDPADLDGDGRFDGVDISIMKDDTGTKQPSNHGGGCCVLLFVLASGFGAGLWGITHYLA